MTLTKANAIGAAVIALANSVFPFLVLIGVLHWDGDDVAAAMLVVTNLVTLGGLIFASTPVTNTPVQPPPGP